MSQVGTRKGFRWLNFQCSILEAQPFHITEQYLGSPGLQDKLQSSTALRMAHIWPAILGLGGDWSEVHCDVSSYLHQVISYASSYLRLQHASAYARPLQS